MASYSHLSSLESASTVRNRLPTAISPVSLGAHPHLASQLNSNTVITSARPQLPAEQRQYFVVLATQPQTRFVPTTSTNVLQTQAPSCSSQNVCAPASDTSWRHPFAQRLPARIVVPMFIQRFSAQRGGIQRPATTLPNLVTHSLHSAAPGAAQNVHTRGVHIVTNVSTTSINHVKNAPALTVAPVFNLNQICLSSPSVQTTSGNQMASTSIPSLMNNISPSSTVTSNTHTTGNHLVPTVSPSPMNQPLAPAVIASTKGNSPLMSADMPVNCQSPTETDVGNIYTVSIQQFPTEVKSSIENDNVNGDFAGNGSLQINQEASSLATEVIHEHSPAAVIKSEHSTDGDTDTPLQIRNENIISLSACHGDFQQFVQDNATDTVASTESSLTETGSTTTEHQFKTEGSSNLSFLHVIKGYFLCLVCRMKWLADYDSFFKHIWKKHTHGADFSCCPTGYSPYCARLEAIVKTIYDKSQEPMPDQIRSYFTPKSTIETVNEDVQNISSESSSSTPVPSMVETVKQINLSESPSLTVPVQPRSAPHECEQILPAEFVLCSSESSSPPTTPIPDQHRHMIETKQNIDFALKSGNELEKGAQYVHESAIQIGKQRADSENVCSASELRDDLNFNDENLQNITAIDLSSSVASNSVNEESNNQNMYEDISDDDRSGMNYHIRGTGSINYSLADSPYSDELPLHLSKKSTQLEKLHISLTVTPMLAAEMATVNSITYLERLPPERIDNSHNSFIITPLSVAETAVTSSITQSIAANPRTRTERHSTESIGMGDDDDISLWCFYGCGICVISFPTAVELEVHVQRVHTLEQNLPCVHCGFICRSSKHLIQHMEDHLASDDRKTFSCSLLENSDLVAQFKNNDMKCIIRMLESSLAANSDIFAVYRFACNMCQSEFADLDQLELHLQESLLKVIECKHCASFFLNIFSWKKHMAEEHVDLPRMNCIKQKLLCYERKMHSNVPQQSSQEDIPCLSNVERDAETSDYLFEGTHHESHVMSAATANVLDEIETGASHVIENSEVCSRDVELTETHSHHEGRDVVDGIEAQTTHEHISKLPNLLELVKTSAAMTSLTSDVSLNDGKSEQGAGAITGPNSNESQGNSVAQQCESGTYTTTINERRRGNSVAQQCESGTYTTTINERRGSFDIDLHGLMRPVSSRGNNEFREIAPDLTAIKASMSGSDGLMQIENSGNMEEYVQPVSKTSTSIDSSNSVKSALSHAEDNLTNTVLDYEDQCLQGVVAEIPLGVQLSNHDNFGQTVSENISTLPYNITVPLNDHCLNGKAEFYVVGQAEAVSEISQNRVKHTSLSVVGNIDASSDLDPATSVESQDGCDVPPSVSSRDTVSCQLPQASDCSVGSKDYFNITSTALSLLVTGVSDLASTSAADFSLEMAESRTILCVSEHNKLEYTENTCLPVEDIGADIDNRQESRHSSVVQENNLRSGVEHDIEHVISNVVKDGGDQAASAAVNGKSISRTVFMSSHTSAVGGNNIKAHQQTDVLPSYNIHHSNEVARTDSFVSVPSITAESILSLQLENRQKPTELSVVQQTVKGASVINQNFESAHDSETNINDLLREPCTNNRSHCTPDVISVLKTVSHDSDDIVNPATNSLGSDHDSCHDTDFSSSKDSACSLQESVSDFAGNDDILENDISYGHDLLHLYIDKTSSNLMQDIQAEKQETKKDGSYDELHYNKNSLVSTKDGQLYVSNETSACIGSRETREPSHSNIFMEEINNTSSVDQTSVASNITEHNDSSHTETNCLSDKVSTEQDLSNSLFRCNCGTLISCFTDGDHNVQPQDKSLNISFTGKCAKCRLVTEESSQPDNTTEHVNSNNPGAVHSKDSRSLSKKAIENVLRALKRTASLISENSGKINRLEHVCGNLITRSKVDPPESSTIKPDVLSSHSKTCMGPEISKTNPALKSNLETTADNGSIVLSESKNTARDFTRSNREMLDAHCKRESEAGQGEGSSHPNNTTEHVISKTVDAVHSKDSNPLSEKAIENVLRALKRTASLISENSGKINRLEHVCGNLITRSKVDPPESSTIKPDVLSGHSETCVSPEISKTKPALKSDIETAADNGSIVLSESKNSPRDFTTSNREMLDAHCKRKSEAGQGEGVITSKLLRINSEEHKPEDTIKQLDRAVAVSQSPKDIQGADVAKPDSARFRCSACPFVTSQSYTKRKQYVKSRHPQNKFARVCRIRSRSLQNAARQSERWHDATLSLQEVQNNDVTMSCVHDGITTTQHTGIHSETSIGYCATANKSEVNSESSHKIHKEWDIGIYKCVRSACQFVTSRSYTKRKQHVKSRHPQNKSARVCRIRSRSLQNAAGQSERWHDATLSLQEVQNNDVTMSCVHDGITTPQHTGIHSETSIGYRVTVNKSEVNSESSHKIHKEWDNGIYKCIRPKCTFTRKWNHEQMKAHIKSKHPYYSCGYCKAPYTTLASVYKHIKFLHRSKKPRVMDDTIALDLLFKRVDIPYNGQGAECKDVTSQTPAMRKNKKKRSQSSVIDDVKKSKAKARSQLKVLKMKRHAPVKSCEVNVTISKQNQPLGDSTTERTSEDSDDSHSTAFQGLKTPQCKLAHSKSENILEQISKDISPVPEHEVSSAEKPTVTSKTAAISNGDSLSAAIETNLFKMTMSSTFAKTVDYTHRTPPPVCLHTKKTVAPNATLLLSPRSTENNTRRNKVTEDLESGWHSSAQNVCSEIRPLGPVSSQDTVRKDNSSAATSNHTDINVSLNSATSVPSSGTVKQQELNSFDVSDKQESSNRLGNVHETLPEICSETASCVSDTVLLPYTKTVASVIVTPKTQVKKYCGTWAANQLVEKTAAKINQNKDLRTAHSNNLPMQNEAKSESKFENAATTDMMSFSQHDYPFRCTACSRILKCVRDIEKHYNSDHPRQDVRLTERKSGFVYSNSGKCLRWKDEFKEPTDSYLCSYCEFRCMNRSDVKDHIRHVHPNRDIQVFSLCKPNTGRHRTRSEFTSKMTALPHEASSSNSPAPSSYFCNVCNEVKNSEFQFRLHLASHPCYKHTTQLTAGASFLCPTCGYIAKSSGDFVQHTGEHLSERRFKCFMCEYDSHCRINIRAHIKRVHNKTVDNDFGIIDRDKQRNVDLRPRLVNIDPQVVLIDPFSQPNYLQQLLRTHGIKTLDLTGCSCPDMLTSEQGLNRKYFAIE